MKDLLFYYFYIAIKSQYSLEIYINRLLILSNMQEEIKNINPYWNKIFGEWFKKIVTAFLILVMCIILIFGLLKGWINQDLGLQIGFLILGSILGAWLSKNGKD